jgi:hypothetical protein
MQAATSIVRQVWGCWLLPSMVRAFVGCLRCVRSLTPLDDCSLQVLAQQGAAVAPACLTHAPALLGLSRLQLFR